MSESWDGLHKRLGHQPAQYIAAKTYRCFICDKPSSHVVVIDGRQYCPYCLPKVQAKPEQKGEGR